MALTPTRGRQQIVLSVAPCSPVAKKRAHCSSNLKNRNTNNLAVFSTNTLCPRFRVWKLEYCTKNCQRKRAHSPINYWIGLSLPDRWGYSSGARRWPLACHWYSAYSSVIFFSFGVTTENQGFEYWDDELYVLSLNDYTENVES